MELEDTVDLMLSGDYKDRLKAEYLQLSIRIEKLKLRLEENNNELLQAQLALMNAYKNILKERLDTENISV